RPPTSTLELHSYSFASFLRPSSSVGFSFPPTPPWSSVTPYPLFGVALAHWLFVCTLGSSTSCSAF
ncbi:hypothetical protein M9458_007129, partial [Cirrhinus mrigala]